MTAVQEVITEQMRRANLGSYVQQAAPIIETLAEREYAATDRLIQFAVGQGLDEDTARAAVEQAGLSVRPAVANTADAETARLISEAQDSINKAQAVLDSLARR